ncbi:hypothetical protein LSAT2_004463 [Lamellibrachia satsuma]|nr:hypothetical protein LSAT2_004463 [Lamellibrachia satsuma]
MFYKTLHGLVALDLFPQLIPLLNHQHNEVESCENRRVLAQANQSRLTRSNRRNSGRVIYRIGKSQESLVSSRSPYPTEPDMTSRSPFTMTLREASEHVRRHADDSADDGGKERRRCYLLQLLLRPVYGAGPLPPNVHSHLPRVVNGIPLVAGVMASKDVMRWRYVEAGDANLAMFLSEPMTANEAESTRTLLRDTLAVKGDDVFGDAVVKATVVLSECLRFDYSVFINDIAHPVDQGLHFR